MHGHSLILQLSFQVSPWIGDAMVTEFTIKAQWNQLASEATDLTYRFGCRAQSSHDDMLIAMVSLVVWVL